MKYYYKYEKANLKREDNTNPLKNTVAEMLQKYNLQDKLQEIDLQKLWCALLGEEVKKKTEKISLYQKKLFVKLSSPALKQDLLMQKSEIQAQILRHYPQADIEDIVFL